MSALANSLVERENSGAGCAPAGKMPASPGKARRIRRRRIMFSRGAGAERPAPMSTSPERTVELRRALAEALAVGEARVEDDPFANPILLFALELSARLDAGAVTAADLQSLVHALTLEGFAERAQRMHA